MVAEAAERAAAPGPRLDRFLTSMLSEDEKKDGICLGTCANVGREIN